MPPEQKSVNRHEEKEPLDKDLEDPCQKFDPFVGYPNLQKLQKAFGTPERIGQIDEINPVFRSVYCKLKHNSYKVSTLLYWINF